MSKHKLAAGLMSSRLKLEEKIEVLNYALEKSKRFCILYHHT